MTAKEKASELINKYNAMAWGNTMFTRERRKRACALIAVDELISDWSQYKGMYDQDFFDSEVNFWKEVKQEIKNLN